MRIIFSLMIVSSILICQDWANLNRYHSENEKLGKPLIHEDRIVFMGNSITESWSIIQPEFFNNRPYINRGISGQTTPQMLIRFRPDVIDLDPSLVLILAGINDIAENTGPSKVENIAGNIISMAELAKSNGIEVIICSILPAKDFPWNPKINPRPKVSAVNNIIQDYAEENNMIFLDYYRSMVDENEGLIEQYGADPVHPNLAGYKVMSDLAEKAIKKALK